MTVMYFENYTSRNHHDYVDLPFLCYKIKFLHQFSYLCNIFLICPFNVFICSSMSHFPYEAYGPSIAVDHGREGHHVAYDKHCRHIGDIEHIILPPGYSAPHHVGLQTITETENRNETRNFCCYAA